MGENNQNVQHFCQQLKKFLKNVPYCCLLYFRTKYCSTKKNSFTYGQ